MWGSSGAGHTSGRRPCDWPTSPAGSFVRSPPPCERAVRRFRPHVELLDARDLPSVLWVDALNDHDGSNPLNWIDDQGNPGVPAGGVYFGGTFAGVPGALTPCDDFPAGTYGGIYVGGGYDN